VTDQIGGVRNYYSILKKVWGNSKTKLQRRDDNESEN